MMKKIDKTDLKKIQLEILDVVTSFCDENNIKYWLDSGTLLGAIRHKGYIPWDDDIDLGMLREDYDRFLTLFNQSNERYRVYSYENNKDFIFPFAKVLDTTTVLYEPDEKGVKLSVNIDVFVYDNAPDDDRKTEKMFKKRDFCTRGNHYRNFGLSSKNFFVKCCKYLLYPFILLFPKDYFVKRLVANSKKYVNCETARIGNFTAISKVVCVKSVFDETINVEFEGKIYKAPKGYDLWLKSFYGDYMQLPPEEKQVAHHSFVAYLSEE